MTRYSTNSHDNNDRCHDSLRTQIYNDLLTPRYHCMFPILELATFLDNEFGAILKPAKPGLYIPNHIEPIIQNSPYIQYHYVKRIHKSEATNVNYLNGYPRIDYNNVSTTYNPVIKTGKDENGFFVYRVEDILKRPYVNLGSIYLEDKMILNETLLNPNYHLKLIEQPNMPVQSIYFIKNYIDEYIDKHTDTPYHLKHNPYSSYFTNNEIPSKYEADIIDYIERTLSVIDSRLYEFIGLDNKHMYSVEFKGTNILVGKSVDYRVLEYELSKISQLDKY